MKQTKIAIGEVREVSSGKVTLRVFGHLTVVKGELDLVRKAGGLLGVEVTVVAEGEGDDWWMQTIEPTSFAGTDIARANALEEAARMLDGESICFISTDVRDLYRRCGELVRQLKTNPQG